MSLFGRLQNNAFEFHSGATLLCRGAATTDTLTFTAAGGNVLLKGLDAPVDGTDAVNKNYVDSIAVGLTWKNSVRVGTTVNGTLATDFEDGDTVNGVTLATGDRILLKAQTSAVENGIYVVNATGAPTRASDMAAGSDAANTPCPLYPDTQPVCGRLARFIHAPVDRARLSRASRPGCLRPQHAPPGAVSASRLYPESPADRRHKHTGLPAAGRGTAGSRMRSIRHRRPAAA